MLYEVITVLDAELLERLDLAWKVPQTVEQTVREGGIRKAAIAARRTLCDGSRFEHDDVPIRIRFLS